MLRKPVLICWLIGWAVGFGPPCRAADHPVNRTLRAIQRADKACWEQLFANGTIEPVPVGATRGVVLSVDGCLPRVRAGLQSTIWKGKTFQSDGTFVNRWIVGSAIRSQLTVGTSRRDGRPCLVMSYPHGTPIFGGLRDEVRAIGPNVWIGRCLEDRTGRDINYFLLWKY